MLKNYKKTETKDMFPEGENPVLGNEKDVHIFTRYFIIAVLLGAVAITILIFAFKIGVYERKEWLKVAEGLNQPDRLVNPERGTIYSSDDRIMAANFPQFYLYMDFKSEAILIDSLLKSKRNNVDSLAYYLSRKLKNRTPAEYKALILRGVQSKSPEYPIYVQKGISLLDLNEIEKFPFFRLGMYKNGLIKKERIFRQKPFDKLASRTIGDVYGEIDAKTGLTKGRNGLEMQYDSLLRGEAGLSSIQRVGGRWVSVVEQSPVNGMDVRSTIDINIQDLVEKSLTDKLKELDAEIGIAIVMEVKTGEIKAITNMARRSYGQYDETLNHAVADMIEPGSTFKVAAMMVALDDGVVDAKTPVAAGNGIFMYANQRMEDHNANRGGYGLINAEKSIWYSSNIGVSKLILNGYSSNPRKFVEGLRRVGMDADLNVEIPGAGESILRWPDDRLWSRGSLPWMSFGYEVRMPPIQILTFYNAIANNGKMVRPMFVKNILKNGKSMRQIKTAVIIPEICSKKTLNNIQDM
jgi:cell division protein FtsI (penicillin-binding protein 3)